MCQAYIAKKSSFFLVSCLLRPLSYIYINFEAINDVLDAKMVLKVVRLNLSTQVKIPLL